MRPVRIASKGSRVRALAVIATAALLTISFGAGVASADSGRDHRNAENTFTKYVTTWPDMAGVVGGDVGEYGTFAGEVLTYIPGPTTVIDAAYHFKGSRHSFTALVHVVQTGSELGSTAVITGQVTEGWLKGNLVAGEYTVISCPEVTCYQGTLDILRGSKSGD
jgi:hypothetical protein